MEAGLMKCGLNESEVLHLPWPLQGSSMAPLLLTYVMKCGLMKCEPPSAYICDEGHPASEEEPRDLEHPLLQR